MFIQLFYIRYHYKIYTSMLAPSLILKSRLDSINSDQIKVIFLQSQNLQDDSTQHLIRDWGQLTKIFLGLNRFKNIHRLLQCKFPNLIQLSLKNNLIETIQWLSMCQLPNLKNLNLKNNRICTLKSLRKMRMPQLQTIKIYNNLLNQWQNFSELDSPNIKSIQIQYSNNTRSMGQDIRWAFKILSQNLQQFQCSSNHRIQQNQAQRLLKIKFMSIPR